MYKIVLTRQAAKDAQAIGRTGMKEKAVTLIQVIRENPFQTPPTYEKLRGEERTYSRRINIQHRIVYEVHPNAENEQDEHGNVYQGIIKVIRMWSHYE